VDVPAQPLSVSYPLLQAQTAPGGRTVDLTRQLLHVEECCPSAPPVRPARTRRKRCLSHRSPRLRVGFKATAGTSDKGRTISRRAHLPLHQHLQKRAAREKVAVRGDIVETLTPMCQKLPQTDSTRPAGSSRASSSERRSSSATRARLLKHQRRATPAYERLSAG